MRAITLPPHTDAVFEEVGGVGALHSLASSVPPRSCASDDRFMTRPNMTHSRSGHNYSKEAPHGD